MTTGPQARPPEGAAPRSEPPHTPPARRRAQRQRLGWTVLLAAQLAMSSGALFGRLALEHTSASMVAACRMAIASLPMLLRLLVQRRRRLALGVEAKLLGGGALLCAQFLLWTSALSRLSVGTTTLLVCTTPLYNGVFERFVLRRRVHPHFWWAMAVGIVGIACVVQGTAPSDVPLAGQGLLGVACALGCSMASAASLLLMGHLSATMVATRRADSLELLARTFGWAAILLVAIAWRQAGTGLADAIPPLQDTTTWLGILGMALVTQGIGHTLQNLAVRDLAASTVSFATLIEPLIASLLAAAFFGEAIGGWAVAGGSLLLCALGWAMRLTLAPSSTAAR